MTRKVVFFFRLKTPHGKEGLYNSACFYEILLRLKGKPKYFSNYL